MQTELHRHLDLSLRLSTLYRLTQERGRIPASMTLEQFRDKVVLKEPLADLKAVLDRFTIFQEVFDRGDVLETVAFEVVEDLWNEGTRKAELRFSPSFISHQSRLPWEVALESITAGVARARKRYPGIQIGLLCIATREFSPDVEKTVDFFLRHQNSFVGFDLAGDEAGFPSRHFEKLFKKLRDKHARITVHAGEACGPENVWEAIQLLGAQRIGHGIASAGDPKLMDYLAKNQITLECCPTSNWLTKCVQSLESHPLPRLLRAGVPVTINTDDPTLFECTLPGEIAICKKSMGMTDAEIQACMENADRGSFITR
jgi:adenosine deaminase